MTKTEEMGMDTAKIYQDSEGNEVSIYKMVRREPEWAANRIQEGEKAVAEVVILRSAIESVLTQQPYMATRVIKICQELKKALDA